MGVNDPGSDPAGEAAPHAADASATRPGSDDEPDEVDVSDGAFGRMLRAVASVPGTARSAVGRTFGRYRIVGELGRGGMGIVYEAIDGELNRRVALKLLPGQLVAAERRALFLGEVMVTAGLEHPGIVPVYDAGETPEGDLFYTMRKVSGRTLAALIDEAPTLRDRMALLPHLIACANAVAYAHDLGILHRDLKPANVVVGAFGETVVVDWGIARRITPADAEPHAPSHAPSHALRLGTPAYMAPEQAAGAELGPRTDVYALGAMLYHVLDGRPPPRTGARLDARDDLEPELVAVMRKAMARDPEQRYPSLRELAEELRRFQAGQLVGAHRYSLGTLLRRWVRRHRPKVITAGALAVVLAVASAGAIRAVVRGRDAADAARRVAERAQASAEDRSRELLLLHARSEVPHDPTAALAWLKRSPHRPADGPEEEQIALDAWARGAARYVIQGPAPFTAVAIAAGARAMAAALPDRVLWWDDLTRPPRALGAADGIGRELQLGPDGRTLITTDGTRAARVWDLATGESRRLAIRASDARFAPRGDLVVLSHLIEPPHVLALPELREVPLGADAQAAAIAADGAHLLVARAATLDELDRSGHVLRSDPRPRTHASVVEASPDGRWVAVATATGLDVLDRASGRWQHRSGDQSPAWIVRFSSDGRWVVSCGPQSGIWLHGLADANTTLLTRTDRCFGAMRFTPDGATLVTVGYDDSIHLWDTGRWDSRALRGQQSAILDMQLSPDGHWLAVTGNDTTVRIFPLLPRWTTQVRDAMAIGAIARPGTLLVRDRVRNAFVVRDAAGSSELVAQVVYAQPPEEDAMGALSRDGQVACILDARGAIVVIDRRTGKRSALGPYPDGRLTAVDLSPGGDLLAAVTDRGVVRLVEVATGASRILGHHDDVIRTARFSPDGAQLATGGRGAQLRIWDLGTGQSMRLAGHTSQIWDVAYSRDGSWLASASADGTVRSFRRDGRPLAVFDGHAGPLLSVDISPTGDELLSTGIDGAVRRWSTSTAQGVAIRWYPGPLWGVRYSADGTRLVMTNGTSLFLTDPAVPSVQPGHLAAWLDAATTATVDDAGHLTGPALPPAAH